MSRNITSPISFLPLVVAASMLLPWASGARAADSVTIVPGSLTQGTVKASLGAGTTYDSEGVNLSDWPLNTGGSAASTFAISLENADFNGNSFGGTPNTVVAFGSGGGITLQFNTPITSHAGEKDLGIFTAQSVLGGSGSFGLNGIMDAAILVSADGTNWFTLTGTPITSPTTYTATTFNLNAPTMAYNYGTGAAAWKDGSGVAASTLSTLTVANFTTPMPNDDLFNGSGTNAQRIAFTTDTNAADYAAIFGSSGGGNWFDVSGSGLAQIDYVRLNAGSDVTAAQGGIRLDAVFANADAVPEPASVSLLIVSGSLLLNRRRVK